MTQRWTAYSFLVLRAIVVLFLLGLFLRSTWAIDLFTAAVAKLHSPSYRSIYRAITVFRTLHHLLIPVLVFFLSLLVAYGGHRLFKIKMQHGHEAGRPPAVQRWFEAILVAALSYVVFSVFMVSLSPLYVIVYVLLAYLVLRLNALRTETMDRRIHSGIAAFFIVVPFLPEMIFPSFLLFHLRKAGMTVSEYFSEKLVRYAAIAIGANLAISLFTFWAVRARLYEDFRSEIMVRKAERIVSGDFYALNLDPQTGRLFAAGKGDGLLHIFDLQNLRANPQKIKLGRGEIQDIRTNMGRREFYYFDRVSELLTVYDMDTLQPRRQSQEPLKGTGSAKIAFDNRSGTIVVIREFDFLWVLDLQTLKPIQKVEIGDRIESALFNEKLNRYLLTYFEKYPFMRLLSPDGNQIQELRVPQMQGGIAISNENKEFYVALPLRGEIFVFDRQTLSLRRKIRTVFGVRGMAVGTKKNLLVAVSMFNGHTDILDIRKNESLCRPFTGYYLREVALDEKKEQAFISSMLGGIYRLDLGCSR